LVVLQYRLNTLGFMALQELSDEQGGVSGNYGIMDQQMALKWVQENIVFFGGDPDRVTLLGHSSGGTSIFALLSSPASNGLFHGAISLSGSPNITIGMKEAEDQNVGLPERMGCGEDNYEDPEDRLECLRALPASQVATSTPKDWGTPGIFGIPLRPSGQFYLGVVIVDGVTITSSFDDAMEKGVVDVPVMMGNMGYEPDGFPDDNVRGYSQKEWVEFLQGRFGGWGQSAWKTIMMLYDDEARENPQKAYDALSSDVGLTCAHIEIAKRAAMGRRNSSVYVSRVMGKSSLS